MLAPLDTKTMLLLKVLLVWLHLYLVCGRSHSSYVGVNDDYNSTFCSSVSLKQYYCSVLLFSVELH